MGYASYLEDIINRLSQEFFNLKDTIKAEKLLPAPHKKHLTALIESGQKILNDLLDVATDPNHNHHLAVFNLKHLNELLTNKVEAARKHQERAEKDLAQAKDGFQRSLAAKDNEITKLKKELAIRRNPERFYDESFKSGNPKKF